MPTAVVTGSDSGIGHAFAKLLLDEGWKVYAVDRNEGEGLKSLSPKAHTAHLDVTSTSSIEQFKALLSGNNGSTVEPIDLLLNIAGIASSDDSLSTSTLAVFQKTFAVNTFGPFLLIQALLPNILASPTKQIGIVSSRVGSIGDNSTGGNYAYRSSKAAVNSIGKSLAMELKTQGVTVLLLHPGIVRTNILPAEVMPPDAVEPEEAARKLWENVVKGKGIEETGTFWHREGYELPW
ncbi:MAG: hypothetical protein M1821_004875 [Bathelium mastoideum]|nr:MAG: hypothetical protein M1821_004875 [Bathelium mastoideum]